jgi:hypothetical protein
MTELSFDSMFDLLNDSSYDVDVAAAQIEINNITISEPVKHIETKVTVSDFDIECNTLDNKIKEAFERDIDFPENDLFTAPTPTTFTMEGFLTNIKFNEEQFIVLLEPDEYVVMLNCNFGKKIHHSYTEPIVVKKNNRGRKKKITTQKPRKIQGSGKCFNSQVTFVVRAGYIEEGKIDPVYKFKVFRNGRIQLPGVRPVLINDIIDKITHVINMLNDKLHPGIIDIFSKTSVININPVMKNYKFRIKIEDGKSIDLTELKKKLILRRVAESPDAPLSPPINDVKYTREDTKLSALFDTPIHKKPKKMTRLNVFMRGKVNILGAYHSHTAYDICNYLHYIFVTYPELIVDNYTHEQTTADMTALNNIAQANIDAFMNTLSTEEITAMLRYLNTFVI